MVIYQHY